MVRRRAAAGGRKESQQKVPAEVICRLQRSRGEGLFLINSYVVRHRGVMSYSSETTGAFPCFPCSMYSRGADIQGMKGRRKKQKAKTKKRSLDAGEEARHKKEKERREKRRQWCPVRRWKIKNVSRILNSKRKESIFIFSSRLIHICGVKVHTKRQNALKK